jgi:hypothetical protein
MNPPNLQLTVPDAQEMVVEVSEQELVQLCGQLADAVAACDKALATLVELSGPNPHPTAQHLRTMLNMGTGYFRHSETVLRKLFRARNEARRKAKKKG